MPNAGRCAGEEFAAIAGCVIISSYLVLFISFYLVTYTKEKRSGGRAALKHRPRSSTATKATIEMARFEIPGGETREEEGGSGPSTKKDDGDATGQAANGTATTPGRSTRSGRSRKA